MNTFAFVIFQVLCLTECSKVYEEIHSKYLENELLDWVPPEEYRNNFTYYLSGYGYDGVPLWISEWGRWDIRKFAEKGGESLETLNKYVDQVVLTGLKSVDPNSTNANTTQPEMSVIIDLDGYSYSQLQSAPTLNYYFKKFTLLSPIMVKYVKNVFVINANFVAETAVNMLRPVLGKIMERTEIHGPNRVKWVPRLLKTFPREILPEWYGGSKDFRPVKIFGK